MLLISTDVELAWEMEAAIAGITALVPRVALPLVVRQHEGSTPYRSISRGQRKRTESLALQVKTSAGDLGSLEMEHL